MQLRHGYGAGGSDQIGLMGEHFVAVDVERCGFDVVVQVFEFALIALFACGSLVVPACIGSITGSAEA